MAGEFNSQLNNILLLDFFLFSHGKAFDVNIAIIVSVFVKNSIDVLNLRMPCSAYLLKVTKKITNKLFLKSNKHISHRHEEGFLVTHPKTLEGLPLDTNRIVWSEKTVQNYPDIDLRLMAININ